jgi:hypothetical protein
MPRDGDSLPVVHQTVDFRARIGENLRRQTGVEISLINDPNTAIEASPLA